MFWPASLGVSYLNTQTSKLPLEHHARGLTYAWAGFFILVNLAHGKAAQLAEMLIGQIVFFYLLLGGAGELYVHCCLLDGGSKVKERRIKQSIAEIQVAVEALVGVCAFSCAMYEIVDPAYCPYHGYFAEHAYTWPWLGANVGFYLVFCDTWFYWWHYAFHACGPLWSMHYQHHQLREPTSFGGPTVHVLELFLEYALAHHLIQYIIPFHPATHRALGAFAFLFGAVFNHGGLTIDYNDHFAHHITWRRGRANYCNYALFFPFWDVVMGTRFDASMPPPSAAGTKGATLASAGDLQKVTDGLESADTGTVTTTGMRLRPRRTPTKQ